MTSFSSRPVRADASVVHASELLRRSPKRITATLPWALVQRLQRRADEEGRSVSNLIAHLLETVS